MANDPEIRASDAERERTATLLRDHAADGRLDADELSDRLDRAYAARTRSDLERLTADLPASPPRREPQRARGISQLTPQWTTFLATMGMLVIIWAVTGADYFWPIWPALGWGIALMTSGKHRPGRHRRHARG